MTNELGAVSSISSLMATSNLLAEDIKRCEEMVVERRGKRGDRGRGGTEKILTQRKDGREEITKSLREYETYRNLQTFAIKKLYFRLAKNDRSKKLQTALRYCINKFLQLARRHELTPAWTPNTLSIMSSEKLPDLIFMENIVSMLFLRAGREYRMNRTNTSNGLWSCGSDTASMACA